MSDEVMSQVAKNDPDEGVEAIEASLEAVDRWVKRFDRDMGGPERTFQSEEERIAGAG